FTATGNSVTANLGFATDGFSTQNPQIPWDSGGQFVTGDFSAMGKAGIAFAHQNSQTASTMDLYMIQPVACSQGSGYCFVSNSTSITNGWVTGTYPVQTFVSADFEGAGRYSVVKAFQGGLQKRQYTLYSTGDFYGAQLLRNAKN